MKARDIKINNLLDRKCEKDEINTSFSQLFLIIYRFIYLRNILNCFLIKVSYSDLYAIDNNNKK